MAELIKKYSKYIDPLSDFGFKHLLGNEPNKELLIDFLNALFAGHKVISDLTYSPTDRAGDSEELKKVYFDLLCIGTDGELFLIEMQRMKQNFFKERAVFYTSRLINDQLPKGSESYDYALKEVYMIALLEFKLPLDEGEVDTKDFVHDYCLINKKTGKIFYTKLEYKFIELPNFVKEGIELETNLDKWLYVLKHMSRLNKIPLFLKKPVFERLFKIAELSKLNKEEKHMYDISMRHKWDLENVVKYAKSEAEEQGMEKGIKKGIKEGIKKGIEQGIEQGIEKGKIQIAVNLKKLGISVADISKATGLSERKIHKL